LVKRLTFFKMAAIRHLGFVGHILGQPYTANDNCRHSACSNGRLGVRDIVAWVTLVSWAWA